MKQVFNKNKYEIYNLLIMIVLIILKRIFNIINFHFLFLLIFVYYSFIIQVINKFYTSQFTKVKLQLFTFIDTFNIFVIRINISYILISNLINFLIIMLIYKTEGINGFKKGVTLLLIYNILKFLFIILIK